ncbi:hypothetical protein [Methyloceanibacter sp.]|uniref:hypothetical protein n=1 Tax=Methyloceanibacter sp. TaxID=1965321 RepID=UPI002D5774FB|nr:hypothetical protein [Methyloceanibacter sp.]HZP09536.1 hypothetical protein [Methyloceanibacter sp.]
MKVLFAPARGMLAAALALSLSVFFGGAAKAEVEIAASGGVITAIATVEAIDVTNRLLTVAVPEGNTMVIKLGPDVQNIETIKVREKVTVTYSQEVATSLQKLAGAPINQDNAISREEEAGMNMNAPTVAEQDWVEVNPSGDTDFTTIEITDTVANINYNKRLITFAGTNGKTRTIFVDPSVPGLDQIQVGDSVVLLVTRAVAVNIKPV